MVSVTNYFIYIMLKYGIIYVIVYSFILYCIVLYCIIFDDSRGETEVPELLGPGCLALRILTLADCRTRPTESPRVSLLF